MICHIQSGLKRNVHAFLNKVLQQIGGRIDRRSRLLRSGVLPVAFVLLCGLFTMTGAQEPPPRVGRHVGIAFPIVTRSDRRTTTISEDFIVGFPIGIVIRNSSPSRSTSSSCRQSTIHRDRTLRSQCIRELSTASRKTIRRAFARLSTSARTLMVSRRLSNAVGRSKAIPNTSSKLISPCASSSGLICAGQHRARSQHISAWPFSRAEAKRGLQTRTWNDAS